jgi:hypothetical protein
VRLQALATSASGKNYTLINTVVRKVVIEKNCVQNKWHQPVMLTLVRWPGRARGAIALSLNFGLHFFCQEKKWKGKTN